MPLIRCPECAKEISSAAPQCVNCGHPIAVLAAPAATPVPYDRRGSDRGAPSAFSCPSCGSEQAKKLSLLHESGIAQLDTRTRGVGVTMGGSIGVGGARTRGTSQTELSRRVAPPPPKSIATDFWISAATFIVLVLMTQGWSAGPMFALIGAVGLFAWLARRTRAYNRDVWQPARATWERSAMCERCGEIFEL